MPSLPASAMQKCPEPPKLPKGASWEDAAANKRELNKLYTACADRHNSLVDTLNEVTK